MMIFGKLISYVFSVLLIIVFLPMEVTKTITTFIKK